MVPFLHAPILTSLPEILPPPILPPQLSYQLLPHNPPTSCFRQMLPARELFNITVTHQVTLLKKICDFFGPGGRVGLFRPTLGAIRRLPDRTTTVFPLLEQQVSGGTPVLVPRIRVSISVVGTTCKSIEPDENRRHTQLAWINQATAKTRTPTRKAATGFKDNGCSPFLGWLAPTFSLRVDGTNVFHFGWMAPTFSQRFSMDGWHQRFPDVF